MSKDVLKRTSPNKSTFELEKYSSAFTLSDMEIYLFPELMMALVLGNIMSPRIWKWLDDPWFNGLEKMNWTRKLQRLKQYVMDHYSFNLDLDTWGLTTKEKELERFSAFIDDDFFSKSNALFGYEGDKYYFDLDIRRHFGLDQYTSNVIPYWKTETVEAMDAFALKPGYQHGAGECVSLAALYAAALFVVLKIPLEDIFMMATPLHSQNYVMQQQGVITNNRRLVTKTMWYNGTELTEKARRALEHERVTIVSHISGHIHIDYQEAKINQAAYSQFKEHLNKYLTVPLDFELFINFLRVHSEYRSLFQFEYNAEGHKYYIKAERLFAYEHGSKYRVGDNSRKKLLAEIENDEFDLQPIPDRTILNVLEARLNGRSLVCHDDKLLEQMKELLPTHPKIDELLCKLCHFIHVEPNLPDDNKKYVREEKISITTTMTRNQIIDYLQQHRQNHATADLAFYAHRQLDERGWPGFFKACLERNPVAIQFFKNEPDQVVANALKQWNNQSIYDEQGLATPDEVVNFKCGDGLEKAICLATILKARYPEINITLTSFNQTVTLDQGKHQYEYQTQKKYQIKMDL